MRKFPQARRAALLIALALAATAPGLAQRKAAPAATLTDEQQYQACLTQVRDHPEDAFETAQAWQGLGGGYPARHCAALALIEVKHYGDAATRLEQLAQDMQRVKHPLTVDVLGQAGKAWLLAGLPERANAVLTSALAAQPNNVDLLIDHARAQALDEHWQEARDDLDKALSLDPERDDAYAYRASARRHLNDNGGALEDAETAIAINREQVDALLERGLLRQASRDIKGARADFLQVRLLAPETPGADVAGLHLEEMDIRQ